jgi:ammonium transporter, Amt family
VVLFQMLANYNEAASLGGSHSHNTIVFFILFSATIVSGAVAERCRFKAYLIYSFFLSGFIYPVVSHWMWSPDGFLYGRVLDFSGSGAVHLVGGAAAMSGSVFLGPRIGKFKYHEDTKKWETVDIPGHNAVLAALGCFILWTGFFAFNGAACGAFFCPDYVTTGRIVTVTMLAGSSGCLALLFYGAFRTGHWDLKLAMNGLLSGMVASCSGCNVMTPWASIVTGIAGAAGYYFQNWLFEFVLHIDDPVGASAVHMGAGIVGVIVPAFLAHSDWTTGPDQAGIFYGGTGKQLGWQIFAVVVYFVWAFGTCSIIFFTLDKFGMLRVSAEVELAGMDTHHHGGRAYPKDLDMTVSNKVDVMESSSEPADEVPKLPPTVIPEGAS